MANEHPSNFVWRDAISPSVANTMDQFLKVPTKLPEGIYFSKAASNASDDNYVAETARSVLQRPLLVIIRHGKTEHNQLGLFTGWEDALLAPEGRQEALNAGRLLRKHGVMVELSFDPFFLH